MLYSHPQQPVTSEANDLPPTPFVIVNQQRRLVSGNSSFLPTAQLLLTPLFRTSGLLLSLPPEDVKSLITLLTFVTANGFCCPSVQELAQAMGVSDRTAMERMNRLVAMTWQNEPLVYFLERESGMNAYTPSRTLAGTVNEVPQEQEERLPTISYREEVLSHSRETYARPREEVERQIAELNGWEIPEEFATAEEKERNELLRRLCATGMERGQAHEILEQYPEEVILRQLDWLPYRGARYPARFLVSAITGDYDAPPRQYRVRHTEPGATEESEGEFPLDLESSP